MTAVHPAGAGKVAPTNQKQTETSWVMVKNFSIRTSGNFTRSSLVKGCPLSSLPSRNALRVEWPAEPSNVRVTVTPWITGSAKVITSCPAGPPSLSEENTHLRQYQGWLIPRNIWLVSRSRFHRLSLSSITGRDLSDHLILYLINSIVRPSPHCSQKTFFTFWGGNSEAWVLPSKKRNIQKDRV